MNEKAELTRTVNEHFEFIFNAVLSSAAIFSRHKKTRLAKLEQAHPALAAFIKRPQAEIKSAQYKQVKL